MDVPTDTLEYPQVLERRWKEIKTQIYNLTVSHDRFEILLALLKLREQHTKTPTLTEITNFTGFDVAIKTIQGWEWEPRNDGRDVETDAREIARYGAELMVIHTIKESIRNELFEWNGFELKETERGVIHFQALNSFNVDITGSRMDIAKKRFQSSRQTKHQRGMDPINIIPHAKHLYWENSILMLLRAPLPFYHAMSVLTEDEQEYLLDLHSKLVKKANRESSEVVRVKLTRSSKAATILQKLTPPTDNQDRRPRFVVCIEDKEPTEPDKVVFHVGLGAMTMFSMFLLGFVRDHMDEKARRAELAVRQVIEYSGHWKVVESNIEVIKDSGEVLTEIDIIARSIVEEGHFISVEVKDFSFWKGWIFGYGAENRKEYYIKAAQKIPMKEEFIKEKHNIDKITSIIVTSIPEPYSSIEGVSLVYLSDLYEELSKLAQVSYTPRKKHISSNFLIRYFSRLQSDYQQADKLREPMRLIEVQLDILEKELNDIKEEYEKIKSTYKEIVSEHDTLQITEKLARQRLLKDTGEKHYQLEAELENIRAKLKKTKRNRMVKYKILKDLKSQYLAKKESIKAKENELNKLKKSQERWLAPRLF